MADAPKSLPMSPSDAGRMAADWAWTLTSLNSRVVELLEENERLRQRLMAGAQLPHVPTEAMVEAGKVARIADFNEHGTTLSPSDARRVVNTVWQAMHRAAMLASVGPGGTNG